MVPSANPDGFVNNTRFNAAGVDLNRIAMALDQPEMRAIAPRIMLRRPLILHDLHEFVGSDSTDVVQFQRSNMRNGNQVLTDIGSEIRDELIADAIANGDASSQWAEGSTRSWRLVDIHAQMRHGVGLITETRRGTGGSVDPAPRIAAQERANDHVIDAAQARNAELSAAQTTSRAEAVQRGIDRTPPRMRNGVFISPAPMAYQLSPGQMNGTEFHRQAFGITATENGLVPMAQEAWPAISVLFDQVSIDRIVSATRVFEEDIPFDPDAPTPIGDALPVGTMQPVVVWVACDLVTGRIIADMPSMDGDISRLLGAHTTTKLTLPLSTVGARGMPLSQRVALAEQATQPLRTMMVAIVNDLPCWAGMVTNRVGGSSAALELSTATLEAYLDRRTVRDHEWVNR
jgi:hypothetical protein